LQARLKAAKVTVLGIGGLGSYAALALAAAGVGDLLLVDDDLVELHSLNRQVLYTDADVGERKAADRPRIRIYEWLNEAALIEGVPWVRGANGSRTVNPCTAPVSGLIGSLVALEAVKLLTGAAEPMILNRKLIFDLQTMEIRFNDGVRDPDCDACGDRSLRQPS
jgi:molybdopterin/thiamine biosynthesis adenylyltransferase